MPCEKFPSSFNNAHLFGSNPNLLFGTDSGIDVIGHWSSTCFSLKNLHDANNKLVEAIGKLALANNFLTKPSILHSSSDGRKVNVSVDALHANYSFKYFGKDQGVTLYTFIDERQAIFHSTVFSASDREAAYVLDGLMHNCVQPNQIHSTDTHGYTEKIFGASHMLGVDFAPRLKDLSRQRIYAFSARKTFQKKGYPLIPSRAINRDTAMFGYCDPGFYSWAAQYEDGRLPGRSREVHEKWLLSLDCNVIRLDARKTVSDNVEQIITCISK